MTPDEARGIAIRALEILASMASVYPERAAKVREAAAVLEAQANVEGWEAAIESFDWGQPQGADWNPCFRILDGECCGRAKRWAGHEPGKGHAHLSLLQFIQQVRCAQANVEEKKAARLTADELNAVKVAIGAIAAAAMAAHNRGEEDSETAWNETADVLVALVESEKESSKGERDT